MPWVDLVPYNPQGMSGCQGNGITGSVTESDIQSMINCELTNGRLPTTPAGVDTVYAVFLPPGVRNSTHPTFGGKHGHYNRNGFNYYYQWVKTTAGVLPIAAFSHELVETITDPDLTGFKIVAPAGCDIEASDVCCGATSNAINWYSISKHWSPVTQTCVAPTDWQPYVYDFNQSGEFESTSGTVRHFAAGWWGAAGQDAQSPYHVWVRPVGGSWKDTGSFAGLPRIAQLVVSAEGVYAMAGDSTAVYRYDPPTSQWKVILSDGAGQIYAGFSGVFLTGFGNNALFQWNGGTSWSLVGGAGNQFAVTADGLYAIDPQHGAMVFRDQNSGQWSPAASTIAPGELFPGPVGGIAVSDVVNRDIYWWSGAGGSLTHQSSHGFDYAVIGVPANLFHINPNQTATYRLSGTPTATDVGWTRIDTGVMRELVTGGSPYLYGLIDN